MRKLLLIMTAAAAVLILPACGALGQAPKTDDTAKRSVAVQKTADETKQSSATATKDDSDKDDLGSDDNNRDDSRRDEANFDDSVRDDDFGKDDDGRDADDNLKSDQNLPANFPVPVPDSYKVKAVGTAGHETEAVLQVPSGEDAYNYYRRALPQNGFRIVEVERDRSGYFEADLDFFNNSLEGNMEFEGNTVKIELESHR